MRAAFLMILGVVTATTVACGTRTPGTLIDPNPGDPTGPTTGPNRPDWTIETFANPMSVVAGTEVSAFCVVSEGREHLPGVPTAVLVDPNPGPLDATISSVSFTPTDVGEYNVRCQTSDQTLTDVEGINVLVVPDVPTSIETILDTSSAEAGAPVGVFCDVFDAHGNLIDPETYEEPTRVVAPPELWLDPPSGAGYVVRGTLAGTFDVACAYGPDIVDLSPESLEIVPGIPANTETVVTTTSMGPTEVTNVSCEVTDAFGNVLEGYETGVTVLTSSGRFPDPSDVTLGADSLSATRADTYYVACNVEGFFAADESPAAVTINPGLPFSWVVDLPQQDCFWQDRGLPILIEVYDEWGNEIPSDDYQLAVTSVPSGVQLTDNIVSIPDEGDYDIWVELDASVTVASPNSLTQEIFNIRVDSTPPEFAITSPQRSAQMQTTNTNVVVQGSVSDSTSALVSAEVLGNGLSFVPGDASASISENQTAQWGLNIITGRAEDECGNRRVIAQSYLFSGQYFSAATNPSSAARASSGITARLNQTVIDDGSRGLPPDDLLTIIQLLLDQLDFDTLIAPGVAFAQNSLQTCGWGDFHTDTSYWVGRPNNSQQITGDVTLNSLVALNGGIDMDVAADNLSVPIRFRGCAILCAGVPLDIGACSGNIDVTVGGDADAIGNPAPALGISLAGTNITVTSSIAVNVSDFGISNLDIDCSPVDFLCDPVETLLEIIINGVLDIFEGDVENLISGLLNSEVPPLVDDFLSGFELATGFALPAPLSMSLNIASAFDFIDFDGPSGTGNGELGLYTQIYPSSRGATIDAGSRGTIRRRQAGSDPAGGGPGYRNDGPGGYAFGIGLEDDVLNQIMWSLWYGGGLELDLGSILNLADGDVDLSGVDMSISATLPPVIMPGGDGNQVYIGLGDAWVQASVDLAELLGVPNSGAPPLQLGMYLSTIIGGSLGLDPNTNEILVALDANPIMNIEVVQIDDEGYQGIMTDLFTNLLRIIVPRLLGDALGSFPLPEFDLDGLMGLNGVTLKLTNGDIDRPNLSNVCSNAGSSNLAATHMCLTGALQ